MVKPTQKAIADRLNLSQSAISMVLNGKDLNVSPKNRRLIVKTAEAMGYFEKSGGRLSPRLNHSYGVLLDTPSERYYSRYMTGMQTRAGESVLSYLIVTDKTIPEFFLKKIDGLISFFSLPRQELDKIGARPVVFLNCPATNGAYDSVMPDNFGGIRQGVCHLLEMGHRNIAYFGIQSFGHHQKERHEAFVEVVRELSLPCSDRSIFIPYRREFSMRDVERLVRQTLAEMSKMKDRPTAVVCDADVYAIEFYRLAKEFGFSVPGNLSIVGFNNTHYAEIIGLTSIGQPLESMGEQAVKFLDDRIKSPRTPVRALRLALELNIRKSVASIAGNESIGQSKLGSDAFGTLIKSGLAGKE